MMPAGASFTFRSRAVAAEFLHTAVVIDDEARFRAVESNAPKAEPEATATDTSQPEEPPGSPEASSVGTPADKLILVTPTPEQFQTAAEEPADSHDLDAKQVTDGFVRQGLVCAVLRPNPGEAAQLAASAGVVRADIVVLDWVLHNDNGETSIGILSSIASTEKERLRLIAIYTGQNNLRAIADRLVQVADTLPQDGSVVRPNDFTVVKGPLRISVFAKTKTRIPGEDPSAFARITSSEALPERLVGEFAEMTSGLVSHVTLAALAALRRNAQRILRRLAPPLDAAYLWHRATQVDPTDAEEHLRLIVVDELASVLVDEAVHAWANIEAIEAWLGEYIPTDDYRERFGLSSSPNRADAVELLTVGSGGKGKDAIKTKFSLGNKAHTKALQYFSTSAINNTSAQETFAMLMSLRSHYQPPSPILTLGSVVRLAGEPSTCWICVQPECDSVRLSAATAFPLLPLGIAPTGESFQILAVASGARLRLQLKSKPRDVRMEQFVPNDAGRGAVAANKDGNSWWFQASSGARFEWLAEMKPQHALWVVNRLTRQLSRVGLADSEWLRRWQGDSDD
jgi:hypothetical protein